MVRWTGRFRQMRGGVAAAELAVLLPFLGFLFVIAVDFARVFYFTVTLTNCARNGAVFGSQDPTSALDSSGIEAAALADASNVSPAPSVTTSKGVDADGYAYVEVSVTGKFNTITHYPGVPSSMDLVRTVRARVGAAQPKGS